MSEKSYPQRKSPRLQGYDYSQEGAYFITICTHQRVPLFGEVVNEIMHLSPLGEIAHELWSTISEHRLNIFLDGYVVMPNHVHGILFIESEAHKVGTRRASSAATSPKNYRSGARSGTLGAIIGAYKSAVARSINQQMGLLAPIVWQPRFHDHIIRSEQALNYIRNYVETNPARWSEDKFYTS